MEGVTRIRLTPAQRRGLALLGHPGVEARALNRTFRWVVFDAVGTELGTIHPESLLPLRAAGLVEWFNGGAHINDHRQRITPKGRDYLQPAASRGDSVGGQP